MRRRVPHGLPALLLLAEGHEAADGEEDEEDASDDLPEGRLLANLLGVVDVSCVRGASSGCCTATTSTPAAPSTSTSRRTTAASTAGTTASTACLTTSRSTAGCLIARSAATRASCGATGATGSASRGSASASTASATSALPVELLGGLVARVLHPIADEAEGHGGEHHDDEKQKGVLGHTDA
jgi:hypothetical protein